MVSGSAFNRRSNSNGNHVRELEQEPAYGSTISTPTTGVPNENSNLLWMKHNEERPLTQDNLDDLNKGLADKKAALKQKFFLNGGIGNGLVTDGPAAETASTGSERGTGEKEDDIENLVKDLEKQKLMEAEKQSSRSETIYIFSAFVFNFVSAVGIVWANKWVVVSGFKWMTLLTWFHFVVTYMALEVGAMSSAFEKKAPKSMLMMMPICIAFAGYVVFGNLSLKYNTVSIYQLLKVATTPILCLLQWSLYNMGLTRMQWFSLIPVCAGVGIATVSSFEVSGALGMIFGGIAILVTAMYTIWIKTQQSDLDMSPAQLLLNQAMYSTFLLIPVCLFIDGDYITCSMWKRNTWILDPTRSPMEAADQCEKLLSPLFAPGSHVLGAILLSCVFAVGVNLSTFMVVGKTSPATFAVVSQGKLICILTSGFLMFGDKISTSALIGSSLAVLGVSWYSYCKAHNI